MYKDENQILLDFIISKLIQVSGLEILFIGVSRVRQTNVERRLRTFSNHVTTSLTLHANSRQSMKTAV